MTTILWLNPRTGISGDMTLGALLDLGASLDHVRSAIAETGLTGWSLDVERIDASGISAARAVISVTDDAAERHAAELLEMVDQVSSRRVADFARRTIQRIAEVEARMHGSTPDDVHLHEVGGHDTIIDTVGVGAALESLGVDEVISEPVALGTGSIRMAHGLFPAPAPAAFELLIGARVTGVEISGETVTPTGAALLAAMGAQYGVLPAAELRTVGYGAGTKDFGDRPNVLQASLLDLAPRGQAMLDDAETMIVLETNLDDVTGEVLAHTVARLLGEGAADAWITSGVGKKGRPVHVLTALAHVASATSLEAIIFEETGSLGLRRTTVSRRALPRKFSTVPVDGDQIRVKHGPMHSKPEFDDVAAVAGASGRTFRSVQDEVMRKVAPTSEPTT